MNKPDSSNHNPDPAYLRGLLDKAGLSVPKAAQQIGISDRMLRYYVTPPESGKKFQVAPYPVQYALEQLAVDITVS